VTTYGFASDIMVRDLKARVDLVWVRIWVGPEPDPWWEGRLSGPHPGRGKSRDWKGRSEGVGG
jgi:hypothetical protein